MSWRIAAVIGGATVMTVVSVFGYLGNPPDPPFKVIDRRGFTSLEIAREILVAWAFVGVGSAVWHRSRNKRIGLLMIVIGAVLLLRGFQYLPIPALVTLGMWLGNALGGMLLGVLVLAYPSGRIRSRLEKLWVIVGLSHVLVVQLALTLISPRPPDASVLGCACRPLLVLFYNDHVRRELTAFADLSFGLLALSLIGLLVRRWVMASRPARESLGPMLLAGSAIALVNVGYVFRPHNLASLGPDVFWRFWVIHPPTLTPFLSTYLPWVSRLSMLLIPLALLWVLVRTQLRRSAVSTLAVELGKDKRRVPLVDALRRALHDPSLQLAFWSRPASGYVTESGEPLDLPDAQGGRAVTLVDGDDGPLAALVHDPALSEQQHLVDGVAAVARLSIANERLHAEVKAQLEEVRASRQRIVRAADEERRRVERHLHDGAQQRLVGLSRALALAQRQMAGSSPEVASTIDLAVEELKDAIGELSELARGIHPAILTEAGLAAALESLVEHAPVPSRLDTQLNGKLAPAVEATAYYVAAEALTNVAKYAAATSVSLSAIAADGWLRLVVADDGVGGADPERGSGLHGLADRVTALGGRLSIESAPGSGTRITAEIPCA